MEHTEPSATANGTDREQDVDAEVPATVEPINTELAQRFIKRFFVPATDAASCGLMLTTDQLFDRIQSHSPGEIPKPELVAALRAIGFREEYIGQEFKWLMNVATAA